MKERIAGTTVHLEGMTDAELLTLLDHQRERVIRSQAELNLILGQAVFRGLLSVEMRGYLVDEILGETA